MKKILPIIWLLILCNHTALFSQNDTCMASEPFCTGLTITYPAGTTNSAEDGADYGCLNTQPAPAWFHMMVENPGNIMLYIFSTPSLDIDFICWGPFPDPVTPCVAGLTYEKIIDCSYSPNPLEFCEIPNGQTGEYYILLITNYSQSQAEITFTQSSGTGTLNCDIVEDFMPDLVVQNQFVTPDFLKPGDSASVTCFLANAGPDVANNSYLRYYLSEDNLLNTENDLELGYDTTGSLVAGQTIFKTNTLIIPADYPPGPCYVLIRADADDQLTEINEDNNLGFYAINIDHLTPIYEPIVSESGMKVKIYPNPNRDKLSIEFLPEINDLKPVSIEIQNFTGSFIRSCSILENEPNMVTIDTRDLISGAYLISIQFSSKSVIKRILLIN